VYRTLSRTRLLLACAAIGVLAIAGCSTGSSGQDQSASKTSPTAASTTSSASTSPSGAGMGHRHGGPVPAGMKKAAHPKYPVGSRVTLTADHMPGMKGARAKVVGAYDTVTYAVNYTPTTGGAPVKDHKWVVQQELKGAGSKRLPDRAKAVLTAGHMPGMKDAHATIASSTTQPVYVVDYTAHGKTMKNHKWVIQNEMKPAS